jgi:spore maturation protein CgeB
VSQPDLVWVNDGYLLSKWVIERFKQSGVAVIGYSADNPFTKGHYLKWRRLFQALPSYDAYITTFSDAQDRLLNHGAKNVVRCFLSAYEDAHKPRQISNSDIEQYGSKVSYIAQWAPERGPFLKKLLELGVPLSLWGDRWQKAKEWPLLKSVWRGPGIYDSEGYAKVIQCSKISLCLLYKNANNLHTSRTIEIPTIGSVLCAERSQEHLALYDEGYESVFWSNAEECAAQCNRLLADEVLRGEIAQRGHERARRNNLFNEPVMARILDLTLTKTRRATP